MIFKLNNDDNICSKTCPETSCLFLKHGTTSHPDGRVEVLVSLGFVSDMTGVFL